MATCHHRQENPERQMSRDSDWIISCPEYLIACLLIISVFGCGGTSSTTTGERKRQPDANAGNSLGTSIQPDWFADITDSSGIKHTYRNGEESNHLSILESLGGGVGVIDIDGDGMQDLLLSGGGGFNGTTIVGHPCRVFHNEGQCQFKEWPQSIKLNGPWFYNHGVAVADYDGDGYQDALITGWGRTVLLHNEAVDPSLATSSRHLVDVTDKSGVFVSSWSSSAAWGDMDGDGLTDLYVCCYVDWSFRNHPHCSYAPKIPDVCPPKEFQGLTNHLFKNLGNGKFKDVSTEAGLEKGSNDSSKTLGVVIADLDGDSKPDIYTCNDTVENLLYRNKSTPGSIRLLSWSRESGCARDDRGNSNGSMGVDIGDYDRCGRPSVWVTNYENEPHAMYHNDTKNGNLMFSWKTTGSGIAALGQRNVSWGTGFGDLDRDGFEDIFIVSGHAVRYPGGLEKNQQMSPILLHNLGNGRFQQASQWGGSFFHTPHRSRGAVLVDLDNDGSLDLVVSQINEPVSILRGVAPLETHWVGINLRRPNGLDVVGAKVQVHTQGTIQTRFAKGGGSYASSPDRRLHFGIGTSTTIDQIHVTWPSGVAERFAVDGIDRYHTLICGTGQRLE